MQPSQHMIVFDQKRKEEKREENSKSKDTAHDKTTTTSQDPAPTPAIVGKDIKETTKVIHCKSCCTCNEM